MLTYGDFFGFPRWRPPPWILKGRNFNGRKGEDGQCASLCQSSRRSVIPLPKYGDFSIFKDGGRRHLGFLKPQIFNGRKAQEGQTASPCQISLESVKPRPRYGDFSIFQDDGRRHLGFSKFQIFNSRRLQEVRSMSPCQIWSKSADRCRNMAIS